MANHVVQVTIQGRTIDVQPDEIEIHQNSTVQWTGNEPFSIEFQNPGPFGARLDHSQAQRAVGPKQGHTGRFKYTVISDRDTSIKKDPVVIVDPGLTGGH